MRRVVVTGLGLISPVGCGVDTAWKNILAGTSGAGRIEHIDVGDMACRVAAMVPRVDGRGGGGVDIAGSYDPDALLSKRERKRVDEFIEYSAVAANEAIADSGWAPSGDEIEARERTGVLFGSGIGGFQTIHEAILHVEQKGPRRLSPFTVPSMLLNMASGYISLRYGFKGPNYSVASACAAGAHAIGDAARLIRHGDADVMVAGGGEAPICRMGIASFVACRAMTTAYNDMPEKASRPYDSGRDGFLMGEGAGAVVLEEYEHARARGAKLYAEVMGYGLSGDAHHITRPCPDGDGGYRAMRSAIDNSGFHPSDIGYINAHGTSTQVGDEVEVRAIERLFGEAASGLCVSSTKSMTGHLMGAAGALEAILTIKTLQDQVAPPTINLDSPSFDTLVDLAPHTARPVSTRAAMSNSFGFGGTNAALVFATAPDA
ncbi:MAG: beta-ketoacyl-ACP synthase II [Hyphomonadaceae bacterium]|nr:beta-ketoacyl-ACP synthase II [Hyphomonadaceae bacterium]MBC6412115.1 beta-ketoacyl-ACP synthase II [Hyphomonadaceae bacterium]